MHYRYSECLFWCITNTRSCNLFEIVQESRYICTESCNFICCAKAIVVEGEHWRRRLDAIASEYKRWRCCFGQVKYDSTNAKRFNCQEIRILMWCDILIFYLINLDCHPSWNGDASHSRKCLLPLFIHNTFKDIANWFFIIYLSVQSIRRM